MARLIDADEVRKKAFVDQETGEILVYLEDIDNVPTIEAEPVKHGKWLCEWDSRMGTTEVTCSVCKTSRELIGCYVGIHGEHLYDKDNYCPNCGARMDGE